MGRVTVIPAEVKGAPALTQQISLKMLKRSVASIVSPRQWLIARGRDDEEKSPTAG